jgi:hypothetical protein
VQQLIFCFNNKISSLKERVPQKREMFNSSKVCGWLDCVCVLAMHKYGPFGRKGEKKEQ